MNYEKIIIELGNKVAQLSIDNAVLVTRVQEEMENKQAVEEKYVEAMKELRYYKGESEEASDEQE